MGLSLATKKKTVESYPVLSEKRNHIIYRDLKQIEFTIAKDIQLSKKKKNREKYNQEVVNRVMAKAVSKQFPEYSDQSMPLTEQN